MTKKNKMSREDVVDLMLKMSNEGEHYYWTQYTSVEHFKEKYPDAPQNVIDAADAFVTANTNLEQAMESWREQYGIEEDEVEC